MWTRIRKLDKHMTANISKDAGLVISERNLSQERVMNLHDRNNRREGVLDADNPSVNDERDGRLRLPGKRFR